MKESRLDGIESRLTKIESELFKTPSKQKYDPYMPTEEPLPIEQKPISISDRGKRIAVRDIIFKMDEEGKKRIDIKDVVAESLKVQITEEEVKSALEILKRSGDIFQPKSGYVQRI